MTAPAAPESSRMVRRAGLVGAGTLASRLLGAVRDSVIAASFPVVATDMFIVAQTIPNTLRQILGEGAVSAAFVPVFSEVREKEGMERARAFYAGLSGVMLAILAAVTCAGMLGARALTYAYAAGYADEPGRMDRAVVLTRLAFPYIFFMGIAALGMGALNAMKRFAVPAFAPALLNVAMIAAPVVFVPLALALGLEPVASLALAMLVGGVLQVVAQWPALRSVGLLNWPTWGLSDPAVRRALALLGPLVVGLGIYQANIMLSRLFASFLPAGSQSFLYYGQRVVDIPQGVFALAIATATLPTLAEKVMRGALHEARETFGQGLRTSLFVAIPSALAIAVLAEPIVTVLFARGDFDHALVVETARSLALQAAGLWAVAAVRVVVPMFHAHKDTRTPVVCSAVNLAVFVAVSLATMGPLAHAGIALAIGAASIAQLVALFVGLRAHMPAGLGLGAVAGSVGKVLLASAAMGAAAYGVSLLGAWERGGNDVRNIAVLGAAVLVGVAVFAGVARVLRAQELDEVLGALRRRRVASP